MSNKRPGRTAREERKIRTTKLDAERKPMTPQQKLKDLDFLFGPGKGAKKERAKLLKRIEQAQLQTAKPKQL